MASVISANFPILHHFNTCSFQGEQDTFTPSTVCSLVSLSRAKLANFNATSGFAVQSDTSPLSDCG